MRLETVQSSAIHAIGYDPESAILEIIFTGGGIYHFHNVPIGMYRGFIASRSKGTYFLERIRGRFRHERIGRFRQRRRIAAAQEYRAA